jgi:hypothetical protein
MSMVLLPLLAAAVLYLPAAAAFTISTELPSAADAPATREYISLLDGGALPPGTRYLKLVIVDPGCGGAVPLPIPWAPVPSQQKLLFAAVNYSSQFNAFGTAATSWAPCPTAKGVVTVKAEAWTERRLLENDTAGKKLGESNALQVHFDYTLITARFDKFTVTPTGPGEGDIEFFPAAVDKAAIEAATLHGEYYFVRVWPCDAASPCPPTALSQRVKRGGKPMPQFSASSFDGQQSQFAGPRFRIAWTQPGTYFFGLNGAWSGSTMHNVVQSPVDGIHTASMPQVEGAFQPIAIVVPFENGSSYPLPPGFAGQIFKLPPIVGNRRIALSKRNITLFHGAHWTIPTMIPISNSASQCGQGCVAAAPAAVDLELPRGVTVDNSSGSVKEVLPPPKGLRASTHHRVRLHGDDVGVLVDPAVVGKTLEVGFRALDAPHLKLGTDIESWLRVPAFMAPRPAFKLPREMSVGCSYGLDLASWPTDVASGLSGLDTYRRLGLNTAGGASWSNVANRSDWANKGLKYGPEAGCPYSIPAMTVADAKKANMTALCPGLSAAKVAAEQAALIAAAEYAVSVAPSNFHDIGYDGCLRDIQLAKFKEGMQLSQPDVQVYDWEGWNDMEHWTNSVQSSANAQRQRRKGESQAELAYRMTTWWFDALINATLAVSPKTATNMCKYRSPPSPICG